MRHIAVIGAGITGVTTAYALHQKGYDVTVIDRQRYSAMETSFANGGQLSASNAEVWNSWATVLKGIKWMFTPDAPLLMNPKPSWHKYSWMAEFLANIPNYEANTVETTRLAIQARNYMFDIAKREGIDFNHETRGILHIYRDKEAQDNARKVSALYARGGLERREVTPEEIRAIEPTLHGKYYGGFFTPSDST
ncbi:MAG: FAD-dependent oxidoreductase, partial [Starkeya sp.]|nr:FAD-dependent oxidoreductase [Starkeya sp.]